MILKIRTIVISIFLLLCLAVFTTNVSAQEKDNLSNGSESTKSAVVNYQLAYPGLLPDSPLYKLKVLRDRIIKRLTTNPIKKIEYDLLQADKTINASLIIANKGNIALAKETALKGENYFTILVTDYKWAYWYGNKIPQSLNEKIKLASMKHQEVFKTIMDKADKNNKKEFQMAIDFSKINMLELDKLRKQKIQ